MATSLPSDHPPYHRPINFATAINTDMADLTALAEVKAEYITKDFPAWTAIGVTALAFPGQLIEIKAVAVAR